MKLIILKTLQILYEIVDVLITSIEIGRKFEVISDKFNAVEICASGNYS